MLKLHKQWGSIFVRGVFGVLFGLIAMLWPTIGLQLLVLIFGAYAFVDGLIAFFIGFPSKSTALILEGVIGILVGAFVFFFTLQAVSIFLILIAIWAIVTGLFEIIASFELRKHVKGEIWLLFVGIVSVLFGVMVFSNPLAAGVAIALIIGAYAIIFGLMLIALALKLKDWKPSSSKSTSRKKTKKKR